MKAGQLESKFTYGGPPNNPLLSSSVAGNLDKKLQDQSKPKATQVVVEAETNFGSEGLRKVQAETLKSGYLTEDMKAPGSRIGSIRPSKGAVQEASIERSGFTMGELKQALEEVLEDKLDAMKRDIIETIRADQRNMHIELIRQFEIQKDILADLLDQKTKNNNQLLAEYQKMKADFDAIRRSNF